MQLEAPITDLLSDIADAMADQTRALESLAERPADTAPAPIINVAPAAVHEAPRCKYECEITDRDDKGFIRKFTLTPI